MKKYCNIHVQLRKLITVDWCSKRYIEYKEDLAGLNTTKIEYWRTQEIPTECDAFQSRRYQDQIAIALLICSIILQFLYGHVVKH